MPLTPDQIRSLAPSEMIGLAADLIGNVTEQASDNAAAIPTEVTQLADFPAIGAVGTVLTVDGAGDLAFAAPAAGFNWPPDDWAAAADVGVGTGVEWGVPVDLSTLDAGQALSALTRDTSNTVLVAAPAPGVVVLAGAKLADMPAGDFGAVIRIEAESDGVNASGTINFVAALGAHVGADLSGVMVAGGVERFSDIGNRYRWQVWRNAAGRGADTIRVTESTAQDVSAGVDILMVRVSTAFTFWIRNAVHGAWQRSGADDPGVGADAAGVLSILTRCVTGAPASVKVRARVLRGPDATITGPDSLRA